MAVALASCAAMRRQEAASQEDLLVAAGFRARPADTADKLAQLKGMPPLTLQRRNREGQIIYTYADPYDCQCLWVGSEKEYAEYRRLVLEKQLADEQLAASVAAEDAAMDWPMWGPWGW